MNGGGTGVKSVGLPLFFLPLRVVKENPLVGFSMCVVKTSTY